MLRLWASLVRRLNPPKARSGPRSGRSRPAPVRLEVEQLEDRTAPAAVAGTGTGLLAQYFSDPTLTGTALTRTDASVNFNWGWEKAPASGLPNTNWSARWTGLVQAPDSQTYTFTTVSGDGVRLFVNGQELINDWADHAPRTDRAALALQAGQTYAIEMDFYYQNTGGAVAQLAWSSPSTPYQVIPTSQLYVVSPAIDAGGGTAGSFAGDTDFSGGSTYHTTAAINTSGVSSPAPQAVYQSERYGNFTYTVPNLTPGAAYTVRLDFAEIYWYAAGQRQFNVSINGQQVLTDFDIFATAGGKDIAVAKSFTATANSAGQIVLTFTSVKDTAKIDGIEITPLMAPPPVGSPPADWFAQNLRDTALAQMARTDDADGQLSRADMLQLFAFVDRNSVVSATDLADLRALVGDGAALGMPGYVQDLANKVVNGDPANADYQGRALGNLAAGSGGWLMKDLVNKWFLGLDRPTLGTGLQYVQAAGSLFGGGLNYTDVRQGGLGDCYFLAGLAEVAYRSPGTIESMFIDNGDGTYTVRFFNGTKADYVTVDRYLPAMTNGTYAYANFQESLSATGNNLWVALAEKAYAQLAASGWSRGTETADAYGSINLGWEGNAVAQLTGKSVGLQTMSGSGTTETAILNAAAAGRMVGLDTNNTTAAGIVPDHVYVLIGYNSATQLFVAYNPWGSSQQLSWAQLAANFGFWSEG